MKKTVLVLAGAPASGKGTLKTQLIKEFEKTNIEYTVIETSSILKKDKKFQSIIATGKLVNDQDVIDAIKEPLEEAEGIIILDGFPRTYPQVDFLIGINSFKLKVLKLNADNESIIKRAESRRVCPKCGDTYNLLEKKLQPKVEGICNICGTPLEMREDDARIRSRLETYQKETMPAIQYLVEYFNTPYYEVDSNQILKDGFAEKLLTELGIESM